MAKTRLTNSQLLHELRSFLGPRISHGPDIEHCAQLLKELEARLCPQPAPKFSIETERTDLPRGRR